MGPRLEQWFRAWRREIDGWGRSIEKAANVLCDRQRQPKPFPKEAKAARFTVATSDVWTDDAGQKQERPQFHLYVPFGRAAELVEQYLHKGYLVAVQGQLEHRKYEKDAEPARGRGARRRRCWLPAQQERPAAALTRVNWPENARTALLAPRQDKGFTCPPSHPLRPAEPGGDRKAIAGLARAGAVRDYPAAAQRAFQHHTEDI
jgi:hypothetical protein